LLGELETLHDKLGGVHKDIKSLNIFVSQRQKRLVLGDFGFASSLSPHGDAPNTGLTRDHASPEQAREERRITPASDVFSLCVTIINQMLIFDPAVRDAWARLYPKDVRPHRLFPHLNKEQAPAFAAWAQVTEPNDSLQQSTLDSDQASMDETMRLQQKYRESFDRIAKVITELDPRLWRTLCAGLKLNPDARLSARELRQRIVVSDNDELAINAIWDSIAPYNEKIDSQLKHLKILIKACV
jgi:serine/threonine protein kinase